MKIDVKKWLKTIENAKGKLKPFYDQAEEAVSAYGQEQDNKPATKADIPINWSNIKVLGSALYSRSPAPEVRKRNVERFQSCLSVQSHIRLTCAILTRM